MKVMDFDPENLLPESIEAHRQMVKSYNRWRSSQRKKSESLRQMELFENSPAKHLALAGQHILLFVWSCLHPLRKQSSP